jgi:hypothetical protein
MQDLVIDLTLAVNYLPACVCAMQSVLLSVALCALHSVNLLPAFVPVCLLLVMDRARPRRLRIFDGSAVLFSIFLSHCVAAMQEFAASGLHLWPSVHAVLSVEWPCTSLYFLLRPPSARDVFSLRVCLGCACLRVSCFAFLFRPESAEHRVVRLGRDLAFAGLCLQWTYIVGLYRRRLGHQPTESAAHYAVYFWPVLYVHAYAALAYALLAFAVVVLQLQQQEPLSCGLGFASSGPQGASPRPAQHQTASRAPDVAVAMASSSCASAAQQLQFYGHDAPEDAPPQFQHEQQHQDAANLEDDELILRQALLSVKPGSAV